MLPVLALSVWAFVAAGYGKPSASKNTVMGMMSMSSAGAPKTIEALTNLPVFKGRPFPLLPAGQKLAIDPATHKVVIVNL